MRGFKKKILILLLGSWFLTSSCQKELNGDILGISGPPVVLKPKVGTEWVYLYYTYLSFNGGVHTSATIKYQAKEEKVIGGEKWLNIVETGVDTTVYLLQEKTDGLYQYTNNAAYLLCKKAPVLNTSYSTFNRGAAEDFTVRGVQDSVATNIGYVPINFYEGKKVGIIADQIWYHENAWIIRHYEFRKLPLGNTTYRDRAWFLMSVTY
jgi:hypothetical protein